MSNMLSIEESRFISAMVNAGRKLEGDEMFAVPAMQQLAIIAARYGPVMTQEHLGWLIGAGALLERQAREEMKAEIATTIALANIKSRGQ